MSDSAELRGVGNPYRPSRPEIDDLIRRAERHPLGTAFLREGSLDAVAATFGVHAFTVEAARSGVTSMSPSGAR